MLNPLVEFCKLNLVAGAQPVHDALLERDDIDVEVYGCVGYCSQCQSEFFALVEGEMVEANTPDELLILILNKIEEGPR